MKSLFQPERRRELDERIARLTPETRALWGRMNAPQMVAHLAAWARMATGEIPIAMRRTPLRHTPLKQLIIYVLPFPKGAPTATELQREPIAWKDEVSDLHAMHERFAARGAGAPWPLHPIFGALSARSWGVLGYRHCDHHLRQFGV